MKTISSHMRLSICLVAVAIACSTQAQTTANNTPENQLLDLRNQLDKATTTAEKRSLLKQIRLTGTFQGLQVADSMKHDPKVKHMAVKTAKLIRRAHPEYRGFQSLFNGKDLTGWKGLVENPIKRAQMTADELAKAQVKADEQMRKDWQVQNGLLVYVGNGYDNICTVGQYGDFEMYVDWALDPNGKEPDAGIYLRGTPQVQIWDIRRIDVGAQVGSGGLYNNEKNRSIPLCVADRRLGDWNSFHIKMTGDRVTVWLNGILVVDNVVMENYWDRNRPIFPMEQIELQAHGSRVYYRNIYVKKL